MKIHSFKRLLRWILCFCSLHLSVTLASDLREEVEKKQAYPSQNEAISAIIYHGIVNSVRLRDERSDIVYIPQMMMSFVWIYNLSLMGQAIRDKNQRAQERLLPFYTLAPFILFAEVLYGDFESCRSPYFVGGMLFLDTLYFMNHLKHQRFNPEGFKNLLKILFETPREKFKNR
jgi:hypothetical protein